MDAILFALVLEVALLQLKILEGSTKLRARHWRLLNKAGRHEWEKLIRDRECVKNVLRTALIEVFECGGFDSITQAVVTLHEQANYAVDLRFHFGKLHETIKTMALDLKNLQTTHILQSREADMNIAILKDKIKDDRNNTNARLCYAQKWLRAKEESQELQHNIQPAPLPRTDHENRVHEELVRAYELQIDGREKELEFWKNKYANDTADISKKVSTKREKLEAAIARRKELQDLYDLHAGEIRGWLTFKRERAARLAREKRLFDAAVRIQSWWRGVMVRRALGQYKHLRNIKKSSNKNKKK